MTNLRNKEIAERAQEILALVNASNSDEKQGNYAVRILDKDDLESAGLSGWFYYNRKNGGLGVAIHTRASIAESVYEELNDSAVSYNVNRRYLLTKEELYDLPLLDEEQMSTKAIPSMMILSWHNSKDKFDRDFIVKDDLYPKQ